MNITTSSHSPQLTRRAFTLVELLVVMLIMAILASMVLFAMVSAVAAAKEAKTRSTISKLNALIMPKYESYMNRRVAVDVLAVAKSNYGVPVATTLETLDPKIAAKVRLDALREMMRLEMPDRWTDIADDPTKYHDPPSSTVDIPIQPMPSVTESYRSALVGITPNNTNQGAECLYLIVTRGLDDADVMENFSQNEFADTDNDGAREFIDGWGNPIHFFRWARGFQSEIQNVTAPIGSAPDLRPPDPFDPRGVYDDPATPLHETYLLMPLIVSAGSDNQLGIVDDRTGASPFHYSADLRGVKNNPYAWVPFNPATPGTDGDDTTGFPIGKTDPTKANDNITNHLMGAR